MSISKGAFGQSAKGGFIESPLGARGWAFADILAQTYSGSGGGIYGMSYSGSVVWVFPLGTTGAGITAGSTAGRMGMDDECVYVPMLANNTWGTGGTTANIIALRKNGTVKWSHNTGVVTASPSVPRTVYSTYALGDGSIIATGAFTDSGPSGNANVWKIDDTGTLVWSAYVAALGVTTTIGDVVVDQSGNIYVITLAGFGNSQIYKLDSSGSLVTNNRFPLNTEGYFNIDTDTGGVPVVTLSRSIAAGEGDDVAALTTDLTNTSWIYDPRFSTNNRGAGIRLMNASNQRCMVLIRSNSYFLYQGDGTGFDTSVYILAGNNSRTIDITTESGSPYAYVGGSRTASAPGGAWTGIDAGITGNIGKVDITTSSWPPSSWEWLADLKRYSTSEYVVRIASQKHWNATAT